MVEVTQGERRGQIEHELLRPLLRGDASRRGGCGRRRTRDRLDARVDRRTAGCAARWRGALARAVAPTARRAHRPSRHARVVVALPHRRARRASQHRVVWSDFGREPRAAVLPAGDPTVPLNSCYVLACPELDDALALAALLNSPLAAAWLERHRRTGARRLASLPRLDHVAAAAADGLAARADDPRANRRASNADSTLRPRLELLDAVCRAYRLKHADVAPLLAWEHRR